MTLLRREIPDSPFLRPVVGDRLSVALGEQFRASLGMETASELVERQTAIRQAETGDFQGVPSEAGEFGGQDALLAEPTQPKVHPEELNKRYRNLGLNFTRPRTEEAAQIIADGKRAEKIRQDIISRGPGGALGVGATLAGGLIATAIDPIELATAFVPVVGEARLAGMVARAGTFRARTAAGAIEGAVGNVLAEPLVFSLSRQQQLDYGMADAALNVLLGTALGTIGGAARGLAGRRVQVQTAEEPPFTVPVQSMRARLPDDVRRMSNEDRLSAHRAALAQEMQGRSVDVSPYAPPRGGIEASERGPEAIDFAKWGARTGQPEDLGSETFKVPLLNKGGDAVGHFVFRETADEIVIEGLSGGRRAGIKGQATRAVKASIERALSTGRVVRADRTEGAKNYWGGFMGFRQEGADHVFDAAQARKVASGEITTAAWPHPAGFGDMFEDIYGPTEFPERMRRRDEAEIRGEAVRVADSEMRPERDGAADFDASARIERDLSDDLDLDADIEESLSVVEQMRQDGRLTRQEEEEIAEVDGFAEKARTYGETARVAAACLSS